LGQWTFTGAFRRQRHLAPIGIEVAKPETRAHSSLSAAASTAKEPLIEKNGSLTRMIRKFFPRAKVTNAEEQTYRRIYAKGYRPSAIIDVGAYEGNWTRLARSVFPDAPILMVEPQPTKAYLLERLEKDLPRIKFEPALLAAEGDQLVTFYQMETGSSMFPERSNVARYEVQLSTKTLDTLTDDLPHSIFLKIDAQGSELAVLQGARNTVLRCDMIQLEIALQNYNSGAPNFLEVMSYMNDRGFVPYDFSGFTRPNGVDLVQVDVVFVRDNSPLRSDFFVFP
jgi:FkbM family methyltransferase